MILFDHTDWQLAVASWSLPVASGQSTAPVSPPPNSCQFPINKLKVLSRQLAVGCWQTVDGSWLLAVGRWPLADSREQLAVGCWQMAVPFFRFGWYFQNSPVYPKILSFFLSHRILCSTEKGLVWIKEVDPTRSLFIKTHPILFLPPIWWYFFAPLWARGIWGPRLPEGQS